MSVAREHGVTALPPGSALELWLEVARWPTYVDGFGRLDRAHERWPEPGATAVWHSRPGGRGTVTEKVSFSPSRVPRVNSEKSAGAWVS